MRHSTVVPPVLPFSVLPAWVVDRLPRRWWAVGNLHWFPFTGYRRSWHFCVQDGVRTIEVFRRTWAWGRAPFDYEAAVRDGELLEARQDAKDERKYGPLPKE